MAIKIAMKNTQNGLTKDGYYGFSWTTLFFGGFPALFRGDFITFLGLFAIAFIIGLITAGFGAFLVVIFWAFMYNKYYTKKLIEKGYRFNATAVENNAAAKAIGLALE